MSRFRRKSCRTSRAAPSLIVDSHNGSADRGRLPRAHHSRRRSNHETESVQGGVPHGFRATVLPRSGYLRLRRHSTVGDFSNADRSCKSLVKSRGDTARRLSRNPRRHEPRARTGLPGTFRTPTSPPSAVDVAGVFTATQLAIAPRHRRATQRRSPRSPRACRKIPTGTPLTASDH
jgi:hypothetical protein